MSAKTSQRICLFVSVVQLSELYKFSSRDLYACIVVIVVVVVVVKSTKREHAAEYEMISISSSLCLQRMNGRLKYYIFFSSIFSRNSQR